MVSQDSQYLDASIDGRMMYLLIFEDGILIYYRSQYTPMVNWLNPIKSDTKVCKRQSFCQETGVALLVLAKKILLQQTNN